jgi:hypothetical protein
MGWLVKLLKPASVLFLVMISMSWYSAVVALPTESLIVGVRQGDWAMYIGAPPSEEYEWIQISVLQVNGSAVDLSMRYDLRARFRALSNYDWPGNPRFVSIDVGAGTSNFFLFLIPRNLGVGDTVPVPRDHAPLKIEGIEQRKYAGADRTVVYASFSNMTSVYADFKTAGRYYWDKETGLLVEQVVTLGNADLTSEKLTGTNLWWPDLRYWMADNYPVIIMLALVIGPMVLSAAVLLRLRKKISYKVTHPNIGTAFLVIGVSLLVTAILSLTSFDQLVSSLCLAFAPFFFVSGVLAYTGGWVTLRRDKLVVDLGVVLMATAIILGGIVVACATYRELGAIVPYIDELRPPTASTAGQKLVTYTTLEGVFFYPYSWLSSMISNVVICLAAVGFLYKITQRF